MFYGLLINKGWQDIFFAVMFGVTKHTIVNHCYVNPHSADSPAQKKHHFFKKLSRKQSFGSDQQEFEVYLQA